MANEGHGAHRLAITSIRTDGGTQPRAELVESVVDEYAEALAGGATFPPVVVFYDGAAHWLADGFHRVCAHQRAEVADVLADVRQGTQRDAVLFSVGANSGHGLRRTNADKRRAVETLLRDEEWGAKSNRWIAERCCVTDKTVARVRAELESTAEVPRLEGRTGQDGKTRALPAKKRAPQPAEETELVSQSGVRVSKDPEVAALDEEILAAFNGRGGESPKAAAAIAGVSAGRVQQALVRAGLRGNQGKDPLEPLREKAIATVSTWEFLLEDEYEGQPWRTATAAQRASAADAFRALAKAAIKMAKEIEK